MRAPRRRTSPQRRNTNRVDLFDPPREGRSPERDPGTPDPDYQTVRTGRECPPGAGLISARVFAQSISHAPTPTSTYPSDRGQGFLLGLWKREGYSQGDSGSTTEQRVSWE